MDLYDERIDAMRAYERYRPLVERFEAQVYCQAKRNVFRLAAYHERRHNEVVDNWPWSDGGAC